MVRTPSPPAALPGSWERADRSRGGRESPEGAGRSLGLQAAVSDTDDQGREWPQSQRRPQDPPIAILVSRSQDDIDEHRALDVTPERKSDCRVGISLKEPGAARA